MFDWLFERDSGKPLTTPEVWPWLVYRTTPEVCQVPPEVFADLCQQLEEGVDMQSIGHPVWDNPLRD